MLCKSKCGEENKGDATRKQTSHNKQTDSESQIERKKKNRLIERYHSQYPSQQLSAQCSPALLFYPLPGAQMPESVSPTSLPANFSLDASGITATLSDASACEIKLQESDNESPVLELLEAGEMGELRLPSSRYDGIRKLHVHGGKYGYQ